MILKFSLFSVVVIILGMASYVFVNNNLISKRGQVVITDKDIVSPGEAPFPGFSPGDESVLGTGDSVEVQSEAHTAGSRTLGDLSTVTTMIDGMGNRTETRVFRSHPRVRMVTVKTSPDGTVRATVNGNNGGVEMLYGREAAEALTMTADQLANSVEMYETGLDKERRKPKLARNRESRLEPLPSSEIRMNPMQSDSAREAPESSSGESGLNRDSEE